MILIKVYNDNAPHPNKEVLKVHIPEHHLKNAHIYETEYGCTITSPDPPFEYHSPMKAKEIINKLLMKKIGYETR